MLAGAVGVASGAAGVGYALARLAELTGDQEFLDGALHVMRGIHDGRGPGAGVGNPSWCTGAAGIALVYLRCANLAAVSAGAAAIESAVNLALATPVGGLDVLCCGTFGRIELLLEASRRLRRPELHRAAVQIAHRAIGHAASTNGYRLFPGMPRSMFSPALLFGQAGIGYTLLRLMDPELPSLLLFD
jgi:lantibiotic modifying enzyme